MASGPYTDPLTVHQRYETTHTLSPRFPHTTSDRRSLRGRAGAGQALRARDLLTELLARSVLGNCASYTSASYLSSLINLRRG
jgi:hypothetical protein